MDNLVMAGLLGVGVAMATGFRAFMPMLMIALSARFGFAGIDFGPDYQWLSSDIALGALCTAAVIEFIVDKFPVIDNALDAAGLVVRPAMGTFAAMASFSSADPAIPALIGIAALPVAGSVQLLKGTNRVASTATTAGAANPVISLLEDIASFFATILAIFAPFLIPVALALVLYVGWRLYRFFCRRLSSMSNVRLRGARIFKRKSMKCSQGLEKELVDNLAAESPIA